MTAALVVLTIVGNAISLIVPKLISHAIDAYGQRTFVLSTFVAQFFIVAFFVFAFTYLQSIAQTFAAEKVAKDLRTRLAERIALQSYSSVESLTPAKLLTNLTSDVDGVKLFVSQAVASIISSLFLIAGASVMLLTINESILGAMLIRVLHSEDLEYQKFKIANMESLNIGLGILRVMSGMIPAITLAVNLATVIILLVGGRFVILGSMTLGEFAAFNSYLAILIFPIMLLGFMSNIMAQANASYARLSAVLMAREENPGGTLRAALRGDLAVNGVSLNLGGKEVLKNVSFRVPAGTRTAIIGPTAAGKTQLLYVLVGLLQPTSGTVTYDGEPLDSYDKESLHRQVGLVFQDSILFNMTLRENIAFSETVSEGDLNRALAAAELHDFIGTLPQGLDSVVSERGSSLSGGQKQRVTLARALTLNPKILLLDDFTARVDTTTESAILRNIQEQYPGTTLLSVTQKIAPVENYDQIVVLMEGEVLATGTHRELMETSPEYVQIYDSQRSTSHYEVQA